MILSGDIGGGGYAVKVDGRAGRICPRGVASNNYKHGHASDRVGRSPTYKTWRAMLKRCTDLNDSRYGGRGIAVCERWSSFDNFLADMGPRPVGTTLDRENNNGNYEPSNCRWATRREQQQNRRSTHLITIDGETKCLYDWCREYGLDPGTVRYRMRVFGWGPKQAVVTPKMRLRSSEFEQGGSRHAI